MIASLMMYARPELVAENDRLWHEIRHRLGQAGIESPKHLSNTLDPMAVWADPNLVLSQTCGMPYRLRLHDKVGLVGTPDYGLKGCSPGYYRSAIVVRTDDTRETLSSFRDATFAYNDAMSQSGLAAPYERCAQEGFWFANRVVSGGHAVSARMVATGKADIAALDAVTWRLIRRFEPWANHLRVLGWTDPTPGLPLITAQCDQTDRIFAAVSSAIGAIDPDTRERLGICDLVRIPKSAYLAVATPPRSTTDLPGTDM